ncbi:NAD(P)/FAD-dependent oxidoreductase [Flammeovirga agarivorans]|uniref:NAD(P)/FAD-dependent oxidoreductase n=1 Tax=Flammeovirga agarivorans TaxID=2726742 RepID=A0A7X8SH44_9BACT|nr:FAD/NAD(P)-binding oxidoreductase [Flammeovirga agarivorans]NLR90146.1 NAD(P)/FAD-dependent oxidoreductase [Flammeovirga agarivorans]
METQKDRACVIIGGSHAGVNVAFSLRKEGYKGSITIIDKDPVLPYHRPPLSKTYLTSDDNIEQNCIKSLESYQKENIHLKLGTEVKTVDKQKQSVTTCTGEEFSYTELILATGASPIIPNIEGIDQLNNCFSLRNANDVTSIKNYITTSERKRVVIIGGGYIGLEIAASLKKLGASVVVLERENRILARVTSEETSSYFHELHSDHGVDILTNKSVVSFTVRNEDTIVYCEDDSNFSADMIILGVGVKVNTHLANMLNLEVKNGICVNQFTETSEKNIFAIGDCSYHYNPHYETSLRLESVQNAVDQAKVAAAKICNTPFTYNSIPWFWSDQFDTKLQIVGVSDGYTDKVIRKEEGNKVSIWYFKNDELLSVDAINNAKAYVIGMKCIKEKLYINKGNLKDIDLPLKPANIIEKELSPMK